MDAHFGLKLWFGSLDCQSNQTLSLLDDIVVSLSPHCHRIVIASAVMIALRDTFDQKYFPLICWTQCRFDCSTRVESQRNECRKAKQTVVSGQDWRKGMSADRKPSFDDSVHPSHDITDRWHWIRALPEGRRKWFTGRPPLTIRSCKTLWRSWPSIRFPASKKWEEVLRTLTH